MQIEQMTITTEKQVSFGDEFQITTFEQTVTAFCDCCPNQAVGAKTKLENQGWFLGQKAQFCPDCNY